MIVSIEGMDGCGKTTVAKALAVKLGFEYSHNVIQDYFQIPEDKYKEFVKYIRKSDNRQLALMFYTFRCMFENNDRNRNLIVERGMPSVFFFEEKNAPQGFFETFSKLGTIPDLTFMLYAGSKERLNRIAGRDVNDEDLRSYEVRKLGYDKMVEFAEKYNVPYIALDTTKFDLNQICKIACNIISVYDKLGPEQKQKLFKIANSKFGFNLPEMSEGKSFGYYKPVMIKGETNEREL